MHCGRLKGLHGCVRRASARGAASPVLRGAASPVIAVHGGAWNLPDHLRKASLEGVEAAAETAWTRGGSAVDMVEAAVRSLEADPAFDAGRGSVLTSAGTVELDAVIMNGDLRTGAVAAAGPTLHPVTVARLVMERSEHCLLVGAGADAFAREHGVAAADLGDLVTEEARAEWEEMRAYRRATTTLFNARTLGHDTVGAVAMDAGGNLAAATSTGGITFKRPGRVGDSPIVGAGVLADDELGAISTTGHGESILRYTLASERRALKSSLEPRRRREPCSRTIRVLASPRRHHDPSLDAGRVVAAFARASSPGDAMAAELGRMLDRLGGRGGGVSLDRHGRPGVAFSTDRMPWALRDASGRRAGIDRPPAAEDVCVIDV